MPSFKMAKIEIDKAKCKGCGLCILYCPKGCITMSDELNERGVKPVKLNDRSGCTGCTFCALICPDCAIEVYR